MKKETGDNDMSTFNLREIGVLPRAVPAAKSIVAASTIDDCQQCDGTGKEENLTGFPVVCRKCGGVGGITRQVKAAMSTSSKMEKVAADDEPDIPNVDIPELAYMEEEPTPDATSEEQAYGPAAQEPRTDVSLLNERQLRSSLGKLIRIYGSDSLLTVFNMICGILEIPESEKARRVNGDDGNLDDGKVNDFVYECLDKMNVDQLRQLDKKIHETR